MAKPKPESRKSLGAYYTPGYVVDYIVEHALGPLLEGKTPHQSEAVPKGRTAEGRGSDSPLPPAGEGQGVRGRAAGLRILDPACGEGAFLLGAYQYLLDRHRNRRRAAGALAEGCPLTIAERKRLLLSHLYGVDIDPRGVELTRLALARKALEADVEPLVGQPAARVKALAAALEPNIKQGNALVDVAFDWKAEFPLVFGGECPGFDVVIGNPPYRRELGSKALIEEVAGSDFGRKHRRARMDLWYYFLHRGLELLKPGGVLSFIVSAYWAAGAGAAGLVAELRDRAHLDEVFCLGDLKVFFEVSGRHMILRVTKAPSAGPTIVKWARPEKETTAEPFVAGRAPVAVFTKTPAQLFRAGRLDLQAPADGLLARLDRFPVLAELGRVRQGIAENPACINARTNRAFDNLWRVGEGVFALSDAEAEGLGLSDAERRLLRPYYDLCDVDRYWIAERPSRRLIYSTPATCPDIERYPRLHRHLARFRPILDQRRETRQGANSWWHLHWPREEAIWESSKLVCLQFGRRPACAPVSGPACVPFSMNVFVPFAHTQESLLYLCGLLNSRLLWTWFEHHAKQRGVGLEINGRVLAAAPVRRIDFSQPAQVRQHARLAGLVQSMLELTSRAHAARTNSEKASLATRIESTDLAIDRLVCRVYDLTGDETPPRSPR